MCIVSSTSHPLEIVIKTEKSISSVGATSTVLVELPDTKADMSWASQSYSMPPLAQICTVSPLQISISSTISVNKSATSNNTLTVSVPHSPETTTVNSVDRKSTRLNSSHVRISYAVFCL